MVAYSHNYFSVAFRHTYCYWWWFCNRTIYLHLILIKMEHNLYKNIMVIITGFLLISWIFELEYFMLAALIIGILSTFIAKFASGLNWLWMKLALGLGWINSRILLTVLYYIFLVPISLLARIFNGNSMQLKNKKDTMYIVRNHTYTKEDLTNMW
jgi:hypothetical protein